MDEDNNTTAPLPDNYVRALEAMKRCAELDECATWDDLEAAMMSYAKQADDSSLQKMAGRIRDRARRRHALLLRDKEAGKW